MSRKEHIEFPVKTLRKVQLKSKVLKGSRLRNSLNPIKYILGLYYRYTEGEISHCKKFRRRLLEFIIPHEKRSNMVLYVCKEVFSSHSGRVSRYKYSRCFNRETEGG